MHSHAIHCRLSYRLIAVTEGVEILVEVLDTTGGHFKMPSPKIRPGGFILHQPDMPDRMIEVYATSHKAAYFRFVR
jgi:hypothetical protein